MSGMVDYWQVSRPLAEVKIYLTTGGYVVTLDSEPVEVFQYEPVARAYAINLCELVRRGER